MTDASKRYCINCAEQCSQPRTDPYLMFFCATCNDGLSPIYRNNVFVAWVRERREQDPGADILDGQPDTNWPTGFPANCQLRAVRSL